MPKELNLSWNVMAKEVIQKFTTIVTDSKAATVGIVMSTFLGYGISYVWLEHRRPDQDKLPILIHIILGLGYAALIFMFINYDILARNLSVEQINQRMPITFLLSFAIAFIVMAIGFFYPKKK